MHKGLKGLSLDISGSTDDPTKDAVFAIRDDEPKINLEVHAPGLASVVGPEQLRLARRVIQDAVNALREALDGSALPGHIDR